MSSEAWTSRAAKSGADDPSLGGPPLDRVVFRSPTVTIAAFRCPAGHPSFRDTGAIENHVFVFPRHSVELRHEGKPAFLADANVVTLYNRGQRYSRRPVSPQGDHCEWFAVEQGVLLEAVRRRDPRVDDQPEAPFRHPYGPCHPRTYLAQRAPLEIAEPAPWVPPPAADSALSAFVQALPFRTQSAKHHTDSDVTNLLFVGSEAQVAAAFAGAGWTRARSMGVRARLRGLVALATRRSYKAAAVSRQELESLPPDLVFQKQNNTLAKRHHVRIWKYCQGPVGETVWVGAATHDVAIVFDRRHHAFTHRIDPRIDFEREKIVNDLQLTGQVASVSLVDRDDAPPITEGTGVAAMETDGRMAVLVLRPPAAAAVAAGIPTAEGRLPGGDTSRRE